MTTSSENEGPPKKKKKHHKTTSQTTNLDFLRKLARPNEQCTANLNVSRQEKDPACSDRLLPSTSKDTRYSIAITPQLSSANNNAENVLSVALDGQRQGRLNVSEPGTQLPSSETFPPAASNDSLQSSIDKITSETAECCGSPVNVGGVQFYANNLLMSPLRSPDSERTFTSHHQQTMPAWVRRILEEFKYVYILLFYSNTQHLICNGLIIMISESCTTRTRFFPKKLMS